MREKREQRGAAVGRGQRGEIERRGCGARGGFAGVKRGFVGKLAGGDFGDDGAVVEHAHHAVVFDHADFGVGQVPLFKDVHDGLLVPFFHDDEHALLRLAEHDLVRRHAGLALGHFREVDLHSRAAAAGGLAGRAGEARRAHVLDAGDGVGGEEFEAGFEEEFFFERVADLHGGAVLLALLGQLARGKGRAREAVAPGLGADIENGVADAARCAARDLLVAEDAEIEDVHERIAVVAFVEIDLAADGGDADAVPVMRDARDHAGEEAAVGFDVRAVAGDRPEAQGVQREHRPRAHREDVANDPAHAGRRALERLDGAGVVVRFHLECDGPAVADVDDARVFLARLHEHGRAGGGKLPQLALGVFIRAMLAPHDGEDAQLGEVRIAPEDALDACVFVGRDAVFFDEGGCDLRFGHVWKRVAHPRDSPGGRQGNRWRREQPTTPQR